MITAHLTDFEEMGVAAADNQCQGRESNFRMLDENGMDVAFDVIDSDEREMPGETERLGVGDANEKRADEARTSGDRDRAQSVKLDVGVLKRLPYNRNDSAQMLTRGQLGHNAAVFRMGIQLRRNNARQNAPAIFDNGGRGFIARTLNT